MNDELWSMNLVADVVQGRVVEQTNLTIKERIAAIPSATRWTAQTEVLPLGPASVVTGNVGVGVDFNDEEFARNQLVSALAQAKRSDFKVFMVALYTSDTKWFLESALKLGMLGEGYQILLTDGTSLQAVRTMDPQLQRILDGALIMEPSGLEKGGGGFKRSSAYWASQDPMRDPNAFMENDNIELLYLYDSVRLLAGGIEDCLQESKSPEKEGELISFIRATKTNGIRGVMTTVPGTNNPGNQLFNIQVGHAPPTVWGSSPPPPSPPHMYDFTSITEVTGNSDTILVCAPPSIGKGCAEVAWPPGRVTCFASSGGSIGVEWGAVNVDESNLGIISGYKVTAFGGKDRLLAITDTQTTSFTFFTDSPDQETRAAYNLVYVVSVETLYDGGKVVSKSTTCSVPMDGLPCIPKVDDVAGQDSPARDDAAGQTVEDGAVCGCSYDEFHTMGLPGAPPRTWACERCMQGTVCHGGTAERLTTAPGWFISGNTTAGALAARPQLWKCPGGALLCPGGKTIIDYMVSLPSARNCERAIALDCQCPPGSTGMLCQSCEDGFVRRSSTTACKKCTTDRFVSVLMLIGVVVLLVVIPVTAILAAKRLSKPPRLERDFVAAFADIGEVGAEAAVEEFFGKGSRKGVSREIFLKKCKSKLGRGVVSRARKKSRKLEKQATKEKAKALVDLWNKLDIDKDGSVTLDEFVKFLYNLKSGKISASKFRIYIGKAAKWWKSDKNATIRVIIITHFQFISSVPRTFPDLAESEDPLDSPRGLNSTRTTSSSDWTGNTAWVASLKADIRIFGDLVGNFSVKAIEFIDCVLGPRHTEQLAIMTGVTILCLLIARMVPVCLKGARQVFRPMCPKCVQNLKSHDVGIRGACSSFSITVTFFLYPTCTQLILRTFVCTDYKNMDGSSGAWLADDPLINCASPEYELAYIYAIVMIFVLVLGLPALILISLREWRYPFDRLYEGDNSGNLVPSSRGRQRFGGAYKWFHSSYWSMGVIDMLLKLLLVSGVGVVFNKNQVAGAAVSVLCCVVIVAFFALNRPYIFSGANRLAATSYTALLATYVRTIVNKANDNVKDSRLEMILFLVWVTPYVLAATESFGVFGIIDMYRFRIARRFGRVKLSSLRHPHWGKKVKMNNLVKEQHSMEHALVCRLQDLFIDLLSLAAQVPSTERHRHAPDDAEWSDSGAEDTTDDDDDDEGTTSARARRLSHVSDVTNKTMQEQAETKTRGSQGGAKAIPEWKKCLGRFEIEIASLLDILGVLPLRLRWRHLVKVEAAAAALSKAAFPQQANVNKRPKPGFVHLSFGRARELWDLPVANRLANLAEDPYNSTPRLTDVQTWHKAIVAMLRPGTYTKFTCIYSCVLCVRWG